jgi:ribosomal protein L6P/L9E
MYEVINVISSFQPIGSEIKGVTKNYAFLLAILGVGFMILVLLLRILNRYLASYDK